MGLGPVFPGVFVAAGRFFVDFLLVISLIVYTVYVAVKANAGNLFGILAKTACLATRYVYTD